MVGHGVKWGQVAEKYHLREGIDDNSIIRFGHTCNLYKNQFVIFGGECRYNADLHIKECYN